jgi:hypothetical protein
MGLYGKRDVLVLGEERGVMSIGFRFLSLRVRRHYTRIRYHERTRATAGGEVPECSWEAARTFVFFSYYT